METNHEKELNFEFLKRNNDTNVVIGECTPEEVALIINKSSEVGTLFSYNGKMKFKENRYDR